MYKDKEMKEKTMQERPTGQWIETKGNSHGCMGSCYITKMAFHISEEKNHSLNGFYDNW